MEINDVNSFEFSEIINKMQSHEIDEFTLCMSMPNIGVNARELNKSLFKFDTRINTLINTINKTTFRSKINIYLEKPEFISATHIRLFAKIIDKLIFHIGEKSLSSLSNIDLTLNFRGTYVNESDCVNTFKEIVNKLWTRRHSGKWKVHWDYASSKVILLLNIIKWILYKSREIYSLLIKSHNIPRVIVNIIFDYLVSKNIKDAYCDEEFILMLCRCHKNHLRNYMINYGKELAIEK